MLKKAKRVLVLLTTLIITPANHAAEQCDPLLMFTAKQLHSTKDVNFCERFSGKTLLVVNTASECGFTPQFRELEALYQRYKESGLEIVGFPSNSFRQEFSNEKDTAEVCYKNYGVSFTMVSHSDVKGANQNAFFKTLAERTGKQPNWNFNKYLISSDAQTIEYFRSSIKPLNSLLEKSIEAHLN